MDAPASSAAPQVGPGEKPFVPLHENMPAEAAGGGPIANAIAATQSQTAQRIGGGVQLETIRENQVQAAQLQKQFMDQATKMLYNDDPNNLGLVHQPASQFDQNVHQTRADLTALASQFLDSAPNGIAQDMLRRGIAGSMDAYEKDILSAGFVAHKAQMFSTMNDLSNTMVQQVQMAPNPNSAVTMMHSNIGTIHEHMAPYFGVDDQGQPSAQAMKITEGMQYQGYRGLADKYLQQGDWANAQALLKMPEVRDALALHPGTIEALTEKYEAGGAHHDAWNVVAPKWMDRDGLNGQGSALFEVNKKYADNHDALMAAQKGIKDYFGEQKNSIFEYFRQWGSFPTGVKLSPKDKAGFYKQFYNQADDPRDLAAANELKFAPKGSDEMHEFASMDWKNLDVFPGLTMPTRQKFANDAEKAAKGQQFVEPHEANAYAVALGQVYHYWPSTEHIEDLDKPYLSKNETPVADFLNSSVEFARKNPQATSIEMGAWADKYMASMLSSHQQMLTLRAQEVALQRGETTPESIEAIRNSMENELKQNRSGYYGN